MPLQRPGGGCPLMPQVCVMRVVCVLCLWCSVCMYLHGSCVPPMLALLVVLERVERSVLMGTAVGGVDQPEETLVV